MSKLTWTPPGAATPLDLDEGDETILAALHGAGLPPATHTTEKTPRRRGETYRRTVLEPRFLEVEVGLFADSWEEMQTLRQTIVGAFDPQLGLGVLKYQPIAELPGDPDPVPGPVYAIDSILEDGGEFSRPLAPTVERLILSLRCPDPTWYDPEAVEVELAVATGGLSVPVSIPLSIGARVGAETVVYAGSFVSAPTFEVDGPFSAPVLENTTTGDALRLPGLSVAAGETLVVDMAARSVELDGASVLYLMAPASGFWELVPGDNDISVRVSSGVPTFTMTYFTRFLGV